jgi:hypothetical protein
VYELSARLLRTEENAHYANVRSQAAVDILNRLLHFNQELSKTILTLVPTDSNAHRDGKLRSDNIAFAGYPWLTYFIKLRRSKWTCRGMLRLSGLWRTMSLHPFPPGSSFSLTLTTLPSLHGSSPRMTLGVQT